MPRLLSAIAVLACIASVAYARPPITFDRLVSQACLGLENCENEGRLGALAGRSANRIVLAMCGLQLTPYDRHVCFTTAYRLLPRLPDGDLVRAQPPPSSPPMLRSYYHFVSRTCTRLLCAAETRDCDAEAVRCWRRLSAHPGEELEAILHMGFVRIRYPG